jgi:hypothetical protein
MGGEWWWGRGTIVQVGSSDKNYHNQPNPDSPKLAELTVEQRLPSQEYGINTYNYMKLVIVSCAACLENTDYDGSEQDDKALSCQTDGDSDKHRVKP